MIFETQFDPLIEDYDKNGKLSLRAMVQFLENAGNRHSDAAGNPVLAGSAGGLTWILTDWAVAIDFSPEYKQELTAQTWIETPASPFGILRNIVLYANGKQCASGVAKWVLLDTGKKRLCKLEPPLVAAYAPESRFVTVSTQLGKIAVPESFKSSKEIAIRRSDIDFNGHVHNLCYLDFALESLPKEQYEKASFKSLRISYKTALIEGDTAICKQHKSERKSTCAIYNQNGDLCCLVELG